MLENSDLQTLKHICKNDNRVCVLKKEGVLEWLVGNKDWLNTIQTKKDEDTWGRNVIQSCIKQWTTQLGESCLFEMLMLLDRNPQKIKHGMMGSNNKRLTPDFDATDGIYECKARTYKTSGTAGEKILGTPIKYIECPRLFKKPLFIVCIGYQEKEANESFQLFDPKSSELKEILEIYDKHFHIKFLKGTDMLKQILKEYEFKENES